jgi:hypothetical protein
MRSYALLHQLDAVSRDLHFGGVGAEEPLGGATDLSEIAHLVPGLAALAPAIMRAASTST